jgi:hypothetical protein
MKTISLGMSLCVLLAACGAEDPTQSGAIKYPVSGEDMRVSIAFADAADGVFIGEVIAIENAISQPNAEEQTFPFTFVTWKIEEGIKGTTTGHEATLRFIGGTYEDGSTLHVTEIPEFELGDRDLLFVSGNGQGGCPLVGGARGRIQILEPGNAADGLSEVAPDATWAKTLGERLVEAGLGEAPPLVSVSPLDAFSFDMPRVATPAEMRAAEAAAIARAMDAPAVVETEAEESERLALEANAGNPVLR